MPESFRTAGSAPEGFRKPAGSPIRTNQTGALNVGSHHLSQLAPDSLRIQAHQCPVRLDQEEQLVDRLYLEVEGTPDAFRFLAKQLQEMANHAEASDDPLRGHSLVFDPEDTNQLALNPWSALSLAVAGNLRLPTRPTINFSNEERSI